GAPRAIVAVLIGSGRWVDLRTVPAEITTLRWLLLLLASALVGPLGILLLRWAERTPARKRRETAIAWGFVAPAGLHLVVFALGLGRSGWLSSPATALPALMLLALYAQLGGQTLVFLAGLERIPRAYVDAARVDGASAWRRFWRITLPLLRPLTWFVVLTG